MRRILSSVLLSAVIIFVPVAASTSADAQEPPKRPALAATLAVAAPSVAAALAQAGRATLPPSVVTLTEHTPSVSTALVRVGHAALSPPAHHAEPAPHAILSALAHSIGTTPIGLRAKWQRVAVCEEGGIWTVTGTKFSGIGFANSTWSSNGGTRFAPLAGEATEDQQIVIGMKVTGGWVPDQLRCHRGGW